MTPYQEGYAAYKWRESPVCPYDAEGQEEWWKGWEDALNEKNSQSSTISLDTMKFE